MMMMKKKAGDDWKATMSRTKREHSPAFRIDRRSGGSTLGC